MDPVGAHIGASVARPYDWGQDNCALWVASGIAMATGFDPAANLRGRCASRFLTLRMVAQAGGLLRFVQGRMVDPVLRPMAAGQDGAAVIRVRGSAEMCAFILGGRAVARSANGVRIYDQYDILAGWTWSKR